LLRQADTAANPFDDVIVEYHDPVNGASVLPTIGCYLQMIRAGVETHAHCQTSTAIYQVVRGRGTTTIGEARYDWDAGDFFVVPPNLPHAHGSAAMSPRFCSRCRTCRCSKRSALRGVGRRPS
jgi:gentisate 1,2-dioxygenase